MTRLAKTAIPVLLVVVVSGCAAFSSITGLPEGKTAAQQFYAAQGMYNVIAGVAANYVESPTASKSATKAIQALDRTAYAQIQAGNLAARSLTGENREAQLMLYVHALQTVTDQLRTYLVARGISP